MPACRNVRQHLHGAGHQARQPVVPLQVVLGVGGVERFAQPGRVLLQRGHERQANGRQHALARDRRAAMHGGRVLPAGHDQVHRVDQRAVEVKQNRAQHKPWLVLSFEF